MPELIKGGEKVGQKDIKASKNEPRTCRASRTRRP